MSNSNSPIIVALDFPEKAAALGLVEQLDPSRCRLKVGKEMFTRLGPDFVETLAGKGFDVFLDLKFHDIPNTVAAACSAACDLGVWMMNVHASGGRRMMEAAREAIEKSSQSPLLIAVTILTSLSDEDIKEVGYMGTAEENVMRLARLASHSGMDGVVCSPKEVTALRESLGKDFALVTPGIRPAGSATDDQRRTLTPAEAMAAGSSYLVIGRPITQADKPMGVLLTIESEIASLPGIDPASLNP
ncbi:orotidine-5'-phosphate decarboxylase [Sulfuriflexus mobilis]|uniref:orotidine-5'-phosphate decarboxylase n=1 Tax=Sulfuriflexus mobilis TaxID=1811807 RepID=UPI000F83CA86|nr:orotidine-5'-phosphate decarboxylase [Sulfuriflexus mobilis]